MKKGKVRTKLKTLKQIPEFVPVVPKQLIKKKKNRFPFLSLVIVLFVFLYWLLTYRDDNANFNCIVSSYKKIAGTLRIDTPSKYTSSSVLCGCLNDSVAHDGILLTGNNLIIDRQSKDTLTNYLITAPTPYQSDLHVGFTFNASYYCINNKDDINPLDLPRLLSKGHPVYLSRRFQGIPYLSIVTPNEIYASMFGKNENISFLPVKESEFDININDDRYKQHLKNIAISQHSDNILRDNGVPEMELLGDSIAIMWRGKPKFLGQHGIEVFYEGFSDVLNYINILIVKSPFATRISPLGWRDDMEKSWRAAFRSQFNLDGKTLFIGDIPFSIIGTGIPFRVKLDSIKPAEVPVLILRDTANYNLTVNKLLSQIQYDSLYQKYSSLEGYYYKFDKYAYETADKINYRYPPNIDKIVSKLIKKRTTDGISASESLDLFRQIKSYDRFATKDTFPDQKIRLKDIQIYFRYPPIPANNDISIFSHLSMIRLTGAKGNINVNNDNRSTDENDLVEFRDLQNCAFEYPSLTMGLNTPGKFKLSGSAKITINGNPIGKSFYEKQPFLVTVSIMGIFSFIISMFQTKLIFEKIKQYVREIYAILKRYKILIISYLTNKR